MAVEFAKVGAHESVRLQIIGSTGILVAGNHASPGDIVTCPAGDAIFLIGRGCAKRYVEPIVPVLPDPAVAPEPEVTKPVDEAPARKNKKPVAVGK